MLARQIMSTNVVTCDMTDSLEHAIVQMKKFDLGFIPIVDAQDKIINVLTDRDIVLHAVSQQRAIEETTCQEIQESSNLVICYANDNIKDVMEMMKKEQLHRIPVVDNDEHVIGVIGLSDIIENTMLNNFNKISPKDTLDTLKEIFAHR